MEEIKLFGEGMHVYFARVQTSQISFYSKERFNKILAMKSNLDGCHIRRCHKAVVVFAEGDELVTSAENDGMGMCNLFDVIATK